jgi:hypothetical protein
MAQAQVFEHILSPDYLIFLMLHHDESKIPHGVLDILNFIHWLELQGETLLFLCLKPAALKIAKYICFTIHRGCGGPR